MQKSWNIPGASIPSSWVQKSVGSLVGLSGLLSKLVSGALSSYVRTDFPDQKVRASLASNCRSTGLSPDNFSLDGQKAMSVALGTRQTPGSSSGTREILSVLGSSSLLPTTRIGLNFSAVAGFSRKRRTTWELRGGLERRVMRQPSHS